MLNYDVEYVPDSLEKVVRTLPPPRTSKQRQNRVENLTLLRESREERQQNIGFSSRPFVLCGLPVRRPPPDQLLYERRNGQFLLQITGHPHYGLPFGQDRIVPTFLATLAVRQQSQTIRFKSASQMLETFGLAKGGKEYRRLVAAFERVFGATMFFGTDTQTSRAAVVHRARFHFFSEAKIWCNRGPDEELPASGSENVIVLSDEFFREVIQHPIPADLGAVKLLAAAPAVLDLFVWLSYRSYTAKGVESIPVFGPKGLVGQLGSMEYTRPRRFSEKLREWLGMIRLVWPECPAQVSDDGQYLSIKKATFVSTQPVSE